MSFAEPSVSRTLDRPVEAEFEVRDIDEIVGDDLAPILSTRRAAREARPSKSKAGNMMARLANAEGLRDAMVLREIFGPPRSMQSEIR